jgi:hypothetical protein
MIDSDSKKPRNWFFSTAKAQETIVPVIDEKSSKGDGLAEAVSPENSSVDVKQAPAPVGFTALFRFPSIKSLVILSKPYDLPGSALGSSWRWIYLASLLQPQPGQLRFVEYSQMITGFTEDHQPLITLVFGNLTQDFVNFAQVLGGNASPDEVATAASHFRHTASLDATYLVYIG